MGHTEAKLVTFELVNCCECGVPFMITSDMQQKRRGDGGTFYCPNGHGQVYGKSREQKLQEQLDAMQRQRDFANERARTSREEADRQKRRASAAKGQVTKLKKRAAAGVCPCCNRTFQNLARHMQSQHPDFAHGPEDHPNG